MIWKKEWAAYCAVIDEDALDFLADIAGGDARNALNAIELGILTTERSEGRENPHYTGCGIRVYSEKSRAI